MAAAANTASALGGGVGAGSVHSFHVPVAIVCPAGETSRVEYTDPVGTKAGGANAGSCGNPTVIAVSPFGPQTPMGTVTQFPGGYELAGVATSTVRVILAMILS